MIAQEILDFLEDDNQALFKNNYNNYDDKQRALKNP